VSGPAAGAAADPPVELAALVGEVASRATSGEQIDVMASRYRTTSVRVYEGKVESFTAATDAPPIPRARGPRTANCAACAA